jgi:hypothetical protein
VIGAEGKKSLPVVGRTGVRLSANNFDRFKRNVGHEKKAEDRGQKVEGSGGKGQKSKGRSLRTQGAAGRRQKAEGEGGRRGTRKD